MSWWRLGGANAAAARRRTAASPRGMTPRLFGCSCTSKACSTTTSGLPTSSRRRGYGRNGRNLSREYQARAETPPGRPADAPQIQSGQLTRIAHRVGADILKRPVTVGSEHCNRLQHVRAPKKPGVYVFSEGGRPVFVGRISNLYNRATLIASAAGSTDASEFMAGACGDWTSDESLSPEARELIETRSKEVVGRSPSNSSWRLLSRRHSAMMAGTRRVGRGRCGRRNHCRARSGRRGRRGWRVRRHEASLAVRVNQPGRGSPPTSSGARQRGGGAEALLICSASSWVTKLSKPPKSPASAALRCPTRAGRFCKINSGRSGAPGSSPPALRQMA